MYSFIWFQVHISIKNGVCHATFFLKIADISSGICIHIHTGWWRLMGSPKLQIIFHTRATKYRALLLKMTYKDKGSYESSPPCAHVHWRMVIYTSFQDSRFEYMYVYSIHNLNSLCTWFLSLMILDICTCMYMCIYFNIQTYIHLYICKDAYIYTCMYLWLKIFLHCATWCIYQYKYICKDKYVYSSFLHSSSPSS